MTPSLSKWNFARRAAVFSLQRLRGAEATSWLPYSLESTRSLSTGRGGSARRDSNPLAVVWGTDWGRKPVPERPYSPLQDHSREKKLMLKMRGASASVLRVLLMAGSIFGLGCDFRSFDSVFGRVLTQLWSDFVLRDACRLRSAQKEVKLGPAGLQLTASTRVPLPTFQPLSPPHHSRSSKTCQQNGVVRLQSSLWLYSTPFHHTLLGIFAVCFLVRSLCKRDCRYALSVRAWACS